MHLNQKSQLFISKSSMDPTEFPAMPAPIVYSTHWTVHQCRGQRSERHEITWVTESHCFHRTVGALEVNWPEHRKKIIRVLIEKYKVGITKSTQQILILHVLT